MSLPSRAANPSWWQEAVFYQIYPLSFVDLDGDGYGDIPGITSKLEYLSDVLGVDALWLSPFYKSPMKDWGYDISDHTDVDPRFGDMSAIKALIEKAHLRGLRVIVDYVINHTSDQHPWFIESSSSHDSAKRDWYVWRDGINGGPPNNWVSVFSGPAWTLDQGTGQWYRHTYLAEQPDLNWRNPEVVEAMLNVARYWLDIGVDGFRLDGAHQIMKDPKERDNPVAPSDYPRPYKDMGEYDHFVHLNDFGHSDVHEAHRALRALFDEYPQDPVSVGEIHIFDLPEWASYYGEDLDELHMPFNFHLMAAEWNVESLVATIESVMTSVPEGGWTNWTLGNHDEIRLASRLPNSHERLAAVLLLTLRGTPFLYYGDELGMTQTNIPERIAKDPWGLNVRYLSRDGCRTPMPWSPGPNAGFTAPETNPWLPLGEDYRAVNVESALAEQGSTLNMYRRILAFRRGSEALRRGSFEVHPTTSADVLVYQRRLASETITVLLNFADSESRVSIDPGEVVLSTHDPGREGPVDERVDLAAVEGMVIRQ